MKKIVSKETDYALRVLIQLQQINNPMKLDDLCKALYIRKPMLIKIIQLLKSKKFIFTKKGKNGGIIINRKYVDINIYELLQELGNPYVVNNCNDFDGECCKLKCYCKASKLFSECKNLIDKKLQNITLKDLSFEKVI